MGYETCAELSSECQPDRGWSFVEGLAKLRCPCCGERQKDQNEQQHGDVFVRLEGEQTFEAFFQIGELIGHGTFGKVYCCRPFRADDLCVKVVATTGRHAARASKLPNEEKLQLLRRIASVQHPNIVRYHQFLQSNDSLYVVMSRCLGPDLAEHLEGVGHLKLQDVKSLSRMMLSAVAAVHQRGLMHRDIKPTSDVTMLRSMHRDPVLNGECLFRGEHWRQAPLGARSLVRGLLSINAGQRLTASEANDHTWFQSFDEAPLRGASVGFQVFAMLQAMQTYDCLPAGSPLSRCEGSRLKLADLKRSNFEWNLADSDTSED